MGSRKRVQQRLSHSPRVTKTEKISSKPFLDFQCTKNLHHARLVQQFRYTSSNWFLYTEIPSRSISYCIRRGPLLWESNYIRTSSQQGPHILSYSDRLCWVTRQHISRSIVRHGEKQWTLAFFHSRYRTTRLGSKVRLLSNVQYVTQ